MAHGGGGGGSSEGGSGDYGEGGGGGGTNGGGLGWAVVTTVAELVAAAMWHGAMLGKQDRHRATPWPGAVSLRGGDQSRLC